MTREQADHRLLAVQVPHAFATGQANVPAIVGAECAAVCRVRDETTRTGKGRCNMSDVNSAIAITIVVAVFVARGFGLACVALWRDRPMTRSLPDSLPTDPDEDEVPEREYDLGESGA